jgi:CRISPR-associated protein Cas2
MTNSSLWLIAYDIAEPRRLRDVAQMLEDHGRRLQQSVFLCDLTGEALASLREDLRGRIEADADRLAVLPICGRCRGAMEQYGTATALPGTADALVV